MERSQSRYALSKSWLQIALRLTCVMPSNVQPVNITGPSAGAATCVSPCTLNCTFTAAEAVIVFDAAAASAVETTETFVSTPTGNEYEHIDRLSLRGGTLSTLFCVVGID